MDKMRIANARLTLLKGGMNLYGRMREKLNLPNERLVPFLLGLPTPYYGVWTEGDRLNADQIKFLLSHPAHKAVQAIEMGVVFEVGSPSLRRDPHFSYKGERAEDYLQWLPHTGERNDFTSEN